MDEPKNDPLDERADERAEKRAPQQTHELTPVRDLDRDPPRRPHDDPTRVLDGWSPDAGVPKFDPTRVLDGWKPEAARDARRLDPTLPVIDALSGQAPPTASAPPRGAVLEELNLGAVARTGRSDKWDVSDVTDIEAVWKAGSDVSQAANESSLHQRAPGEAEEPLTVWRKAGVARLLPHWKPGAWIGALKRVFGAVSQVHSTPDGPIVDTFAPHVLLALWPPQGADMPFLARWPQRLLLSSVHPGDAGEELLKHLPADAELWLAEHDIDWALAGEAVLLHDPGLRDFQLKELRAFVDAERQATWDRVNLAYRLPVTGQPLERV